MSNPTKPQRLSDEEIAGMPGDQGDCCCDQSGPALSRCLTCQVHALAAELKKRTRERDAWMRAAEDYGSHICPRMRPCNLCEDASARLSRDLKALEEKGPADDS